jgi:hypothetical protein
VERDGSDWAQAQQLLKLTPAQRIADGIHTANTMLKIQGAARGTA